MIKKTLILILIAISFNLKSFSMSLEEGKQAFAQYVEYSNSYAKDLSKLYEKDTLIKRIITKKDGSTREKVLSVDMYKTMLTYYSKIALWQGYKNKYTDLKFTKNGEDIEVNCIRHPSTSNDALRAKLIFTKNDFGRTIIKEECFHTNASFLLK